MADVRREYLHHLLRQLAKPADREVVPDSGKPVVGGEAKEERHALAYGPVRNPGDGQLEVSP